MSSLTNTPPSNSTITQLFNDYGRIESRNPHQTHKTPPQKRSVTGLIICLNYRKALISSGFRA